MNDTEFAQLGYFGFPIDTPNLDRLAAGGLHHNNTTTVLCSPS